MSERLISNECFKSTGFSYTLSLISGKYKMTILYVLAEFGVVRFNEMKKYIEKISYKTLSATLKELEADKLVQVIAKQVNDSSQRGGITELDYLREWNTFRKGIELGHGL